MTFPVLKVQSIVNCLAELDIPMTAAHIKEPQPAHLRGIYETIVETITGANLDSVRQNFQVCRQQHRRGMGGDITPWSRGSAHSWCKT